MLHLTVAQDGSGDYASVSEAVLAVPYELEAEIVIGPGVYREKLVCEKRCITLRGAGADQTILVWADGGKLPHPDGRPTHTFRSYTAFFSGESLTVEDLTIANDAGPGSLVGQAIAAYVDSARAVFRRVKLLVMAAVSVLLGVCVSIGGTIGFVGLIIPHMMRMLLGPDHNRLLPASLLAGASFLLLADLAGRSLFSPLELPIGVVTSLVGAVVFIVIFYRSRKRGTVC